MIILALRMEGKWLERAFEAGADGAMSKAIHPVALATLVARGGQRTHRAFAGQAAGR